jgi:two-component system sensor histidine kinase PhoQ
LSILQNLGNPDPAERDTILEQTGLMRQSIERHTQRATIRSPRYLAPVINVLPVIERICSTLTKLYEPGSIAFNLDGVNSEFTVRMDEADLFEVIGNILENACKYGSKTIWVTTDAESNTLNFEDDGPGFPDIDLNQLTQRGVRADSQTQGSGMGLAAVQQLMGAHGGQLIPNHRALCGAHIALVFLQ